MHSANRLIKCVAVGTELPHQRKVEKLRAKMEPSQDFQSQIPLKNITPIGEERWPKQF
jgi:hypothetical protein